jgi:2-dehydro-3-deoxyphosphogluconate aldolase / (4S)-4-hydroxy-2-oxoglutarate aldolase
MGSKLVSKPLLEARDYGKIQELTEKAITIVNEVKA